jgi:SCY1-like protein 1
VIEQGDSIWIMTERVRPLRGVLFSWGNSSGNRKGKEKNKEREEWTIWGLHRVAIALAFINTTCASTHGNICIDSIFLSPSGEWRIGGFEVLSSTKDENPVLFVSPIVAYNSWIDKSRRPLVSNYTGRQIYRRRK